MTNAQIIFHESLKLMNEGKIKSTGNIIEMLTPDGDRTFIQEPETIHTFAHWKELGFIVRKGEHAVGSFPVWKYTAPAKTEEDEEKAQASGRCFLKKAFWFTAGQVEQITA